MDFSGRVLNWKSEDDENTSKYSKSDLIFGISFITLFFMVSIPLFMLMPCYVENQVVSFEVWARLFSKLMKNITVQNYHRLCLALAVTILFLEDLRDKEELLHAPIITNWFSYGLRIYFFFLIHHE